jgi:ABC-type molybdenum transport system ATPase subunit/photorepair protein PhrA
MKNKLIGHLSWSTTTCLIAKALVNKPIILMLDEPTNELIRKVRMIYFLLKGF